MAQYAWSGDVKTMEWEPPTFGIAAVKVFTLVDGGDGWCAAEVHYGSPEGDAGVDVCGQDARYTVEIETYHPSGRRYLNRVALCSYEHTNKRYRRIFSLQPWHFAPEAQP